MNNPANWHTITLYSKEGCHLCEDAKAALVSLGDEFNVILEEVDITLDPTLFQQYQYTIPVMIVDQNIKLELRIDAHKLRRALAEGYGPKIT